MHMQAVILAAGDISDTESGIRTTGGRRARALIRAQHFPGEAPRANLRAALLSLNCAMCNCSRGRGTCPV